MGGCGTKQIEGGDGSSVYFVLSPGHLPHNIHEQTSSLLPLIKRCDSKNLTNILSVHS